MIKFNYLNSCGKSAETSDQTTDVSHVITLNTHYDGCACTQEGVPSQTTYTFKPTRPGTYFFKFTANTPDGYITKTLAVD